MNKTYFTIILLFFLSINSFSQEKLMFGVNTGLTYSEFRGNGFVKHNKSKIDYLVGGFVEYKFNARLSTVINVNYERKSIHYFYPKPYEGNVIGPPQEDIENLTRFRYISFPILLKYYPIINSSFYINSGPYFASLLDVTNYNEGIKNDLDFNDSFKKLDVGFSIGVGYELEINKMNYLGIELRNNLGIKDLSSLEYSPFNSTKSNAINLIINWKMKI